MGRLDSNSGQRISLIVDLDHIHRKGLGGLDHHPGPRCEGRAARRIFDWRFRDFVLDQSRAHQRTDRQAKFRGRVTGAGQLTGDFLQAGNTAPCVLQKIGPPQVELPRKAPPLARNSRARWKGDYEMDGYPRHVTLKLTNHKPDGASAQLVIVGKKPIMSRSSWSPRRVVSSRSNHPSSDHLRRPVSERGWRDQRDVYPQSFRVAASSCGAYLPTLDENLPHHRRAARLPGRRSLSGTVDVPRAILRIPECMRVRRRASFIGSNGSFLPAIGSSRRQSGATVPSILAVTTATSTPSLPRLGGKFGNRPPGGPAPSTPAVVDGTALRG